MILLGSDELEQVERQMVKSERMAAEMELAETIFVGEGMEEATRAFEK